MSVKNRLDNELVRRGLVTTRSQAESYIKLSKVEVDGKFITKSGYFVSENAKIKLTQDEQYVGRAGLKLESVARDLKLSFKDKVVLDVGSSTGGFTQFALLNGAKLVYAVDVGTGQLHPKLRGESKVELHESTDIRDFAPSVKPDIILMDVSFISVRDILPHLVENVAKSSSQFVVMVKPQFETTKENINKGVIKNDSIRRKILSDFENWTKKYFVITAKKDSDVAGAKGNRERFYLLTIARP